MIAVGSVESKGKGFKGRVRTRRCRAGAEAGRSRSDERKWEERSGLDLPAEDAT